MADREKWALYRVPEGREDDCDYIPPSCIAPIWPEEDEWRPIKDFPNYEVSIYGEIRNVKFDRIMCPRISRDGYYIVHLRNGNGNGKQPYVHRLVAETFIPNPHNLPCVNHIDGCKGNNMINNLEWVSYSENIEHAIFTGLSPQYHRSTGGYRIRIIETGEEFISLRECERKTGLDHTGISAALNHTDGCTKFHGYHFERID